MTKIRCVTCGQLKARALFPKHHTSWCLACTRLDAHARRKNVWQHGSSGYQNHGCRCRVCKDAWNVYVQARMALRKVEEAEPIAAPTSSWWLSAPKVGFTATVEREHSPRMKRSRFGAGMSKPISTDELSR